MKIFVLSVGKSSKPAKNIIYTTNSQNKQRLQKQNVKKCVNYYKHR